MPRLNYGTLLENVVTLEVARLGFDYSDRVGVLAFATAFAMPPLTECWAKTANERKISPFFNECFLSQLTELATTPYSLQKAWVACVQNVLNLPFCRFRVADNENLRYEFAGPNAALLVAMLATHLRREIRIWANDNGERYGEVNPAVPNSQSELERTVEYGARLLGADPIGSVNYVGTNFPDSIDALSEWLTQGAGNAATVRVGFLDPDNYAEGNTQVTRWQHQNWLRVLAEGRERAFSAMYSFCMNRGPQNANRNQRLAWFHADECERYPRSLVFEYGNHQTGVKIRWPEAKIDEISGKLRERVNNAWSSWHERLGPLTIHSDGNPGNGNH